MRRVVSWLLVAALVVAGAWWVAGLPGRVALDVAGLSLEASAPVGVVLGVVALLALYAVFRAIGFVLFLPGRIGAWRAGRRRAAGDAAVTRALVTLAAGEGRAARKAAEKARSLLGSTPQTLLLAAEAARQEGDEDAAAKIYETMTGRTDAAFLGLRGLFRQALLRGDWDAAAKFARQAEAIQPGASWLRQARLELAARTGDWAPALALAGPDAPMAALATAASVAAGSAEGAERLARQAFRADPSFVPAALEYARRLRVAGREGRALEVLREAWTNTAHPTLAELALLPVTEPLARVRAAAGLVRHRPEHPESHLLLGRLSLEAGLVGEAQRHAKAAVASGLRDRRAFLLLADVEEAAHGDPEAVRMALREAANADPDPAWHCGVCNAAYPEWHPACPQCQTPASLTWGRKAGAARAVLLSPVEKMTTVVLPGPDQAA